MKKTVQKLVLLSLAIIMLLSLTACNTNTNEENNTGFFVEYTDGYGDTTTLDTVPQRLVSVSPNVTEIICSLGLEEKLVGKTEYCDYPESVQDVQTVGDILNPSVEKIIELNPDLVISEGMQSSSDFATALRNAGIKFVSLRTNTTIEGTYKSIQDVGLLTDTSKKAEEIVNDMKTRLEKISEKVKNVEKKKVFYVVGFGEYGLSTATGDTYVNELLQSAGLINVASDGTNWSYSVEKLYEHNPDIVICSQYYDSKAGLKADASLKDLDAIKNDNIIEIDNNKLDRQTARNIEAIEELVEKIYNIK